MKGVVPLECSRRALKLPAFLLYCYLLLERSVFVLIPYNNGVMSVPFRFLQVSFAMLFFDRYTACKLWNDAHAEICKLKFVS